MLGLALHVFSSGCLPGAAPGLRDPQSLVLLLHHRHHSTCAHGKRSTAHLYHIPVGMKKVLDKEFFDQKTLVVAKDLLGKVPVRKVSIKTLDNLLLESH